jgi:hypothetical protein
VVMLQSIYISTMYSNMGVVPCHVTLYVLSVCKVSEFPENLLYLANINDYLN